MTTLSAPSPTQPPAAVGAPCAACGWPLVSERGATPWCAQCGWNIDCYEPGRRCKDMRWKWADRLSFQTAYDLNARQFADLAGRPVDKPGINWVGAALMLIAVTLMASVVGLAVVGVWLIVHFQTVALDVIGVVMICVAIALRPRIPGLGRHSVPVDPASLPRLNQLIGDVAASVGAPRPRTLLFTTQFNASSGSYGLLRRRVLTIGLPLWLSLTPQERVALLGHELGHFVNGDVRRGPVTWFAFDMLSKLVSLTSPAPRPLPSRLNRVLGDGLSSGVAELFAQWVLAILCSFFSLCKLLVDGLGMRASHHAEYAADTLAVRAGGSAGASSLIDTLSLESVCMTMVKRSIRQAETPAEWRTSIAVGRDELTEKRSRYRQLSMRDQASLFASHPPGGLRADIIETRPPSSAAVVLTDADAAQIDAELGHHYRSMRTMLANTDG